MALVTRWQCDLQAHGSLQSRSSAPGEAAQSILILSSLAELFSEDLTVVLSLRSLLEKEGGG